MANIVDGQNLSLVDALSRHGFKREGEEIVLEDGNRKFVLGELQGVVKEIPVLGNDNENIQAGNSANGEQEIKEGAQSTGHLDQNGDTILHDGEPLENHNLQEENTRQTKALEQVGFHIVGDDGKQSSGNGSNTNKNSGGTVITARDDGRPGLQLKTKEQDEEDERKKKSKKS